MTKMSKCKIYIILLCLAIITTTMYGCSQNPYKYEIINGLSHSVIRGLDTDRLMTTPKALRSKIVDHHKVPS